MKSPLLAILCLMGMGLAHGMAVASDGCKSVVIAGHVEGRESFERELGMGMSFKIARADDIDEAGWTYKIGPSHPRDDEWDNYIDLTPPYHFGEASYIGPGWGARAQDVAQPRSWTFWFFSSPRQAAAANAALLNFIYPSRQHPDQEASGAAIDRFDIGKGRFTIVSSNIRNGTASRGEPSEKDDWGAVLGITFEVQLVFPPNFRASEGLITISAACPKKGEWRR